MKIPLDPPVTISDEKYAGLAVAVLAGGASSRFGADKALTRLCEDGPTLLERVVRISLQLTSAVFVVGHERYAELLGECPIVPDRNPGQGPLAGIAAALHGIPATRLLVLACDTPCLSLPLLSWMAAIETSADVAMPRTGDGRWQPMPAIYWQSSRPHIDRALADGARSVAALCDRADVLELSETELRRYDPELGSFFSLNRPDQLARARQCVSCS